jgi:DNA primase
MRFPQSFIDDLRLHANLVQVVQEYVPLKRLGRTYKGLCPFHAEKTPSFHVDPERGFFHCFGCGAGGDVFKFLELHEKLGFQDAVRTLAQKFGLALPEPVEGEGDEGREDARLRESLLKIHEVAAAHFRAQLAGPAGARARQQLRDRGVAPETIDALGLGYAPPAREGLKAVLVGEGFPTQLLVQSGLLAQREGGEVVDRFRNRLMIPICRETTGSVIAFGGRAMDQDQGGPKYLNSPETPIYSKGRTLYGLHLSKAAIRKRGFAVLVEGYFDFAQVFQTEAAPVVASCGTALTTQQARLLRRFTSRVILSYDPDAAGEGAAARSCDLLVAEGFEVNVVALEPGEDPDTFIRRRGAGAYRERLRGSQPYLEYLLDQAADGLDFGHDDSRRRFLNRMLGVAARIPDAAARDQFADRIAHKARITEDVVRAEIRKAAVGRKTAVTERELPGSGQLKDAEKALIWWLINRPDEAFPELEALEGGDLEHAAGRTILDLARSLQSTQPALLPSTLIQRLSTMEAQLVTRIASESRPPALQVADCVRALKRVRWERQQSAVRLEIDRLQQAGQDGRQMNILLAQMRELAHRIEELR